MVRVYLEKWHDIISFGYYREETDIILDIGKYRIYLSKEGKNNGGWHSWRQQQELIYRRIKTQGYGDRFGEKGHESQSDTMFFSEFFLVHFTDT